MKVTYKVQVYKEEVDTKDYGKVEKDVVHALTEDLISRLSTEAFELDKLYKAPTAEQVERIVKDGKNAVDEILGAGSPNGSAPTGKSNLHSSAEDEDVPSDEDLESLVEEASVSSSVKNAAPPTKQPSPVPVKQPEPTPNMGLKIGKATTSSESKGAVEAKVANEKIKGMSSEDFLAALENGTL